MVARACGSRLRRLAAAVLACLAAAVPAQAAEPDHGAIARRALERVILPAAGGFETAAGALAAAAPPDCAAIDGEALRGRVHEAWDAWMGLQHLRFGPLEEESRAFEVAFWPDGRDATGRTVGRLLASEDPAVGDPAAFAEVSVAARGLHALERLLWDADGPVALGEPYRCRYVSAVAQDLDRVAGEIAARWRDPWAGIVATAGEPGNAVFLAPAEVTQRLYATLRGALEETAALRLGAPLGEVGRPRPRQAEAWRSGRSFRNVALVLDAAERMTGAAFAPALGQEARAEIAGALAYARQSLDRAREAGALPQAVEASRIRVEVLQQAVERLVVAMRAHLGPGLGVAEGFNSADGD